MPRINPVSMTVAPGANALGRQQALAQAMMSGRAGQQRVQHPMQAVSNFSGKLSGALLARRAERQENAKRQKLAEALVGMGGGSNPEFTRALVEHSPEAALRYQLDQQQQQQGWAHDAQLLEQQRAHDARLLTERRAYEDSRPGPDEKAYQDYRRGIEGANARRTAAGDPHTAAILNREGYMQKRRGAGANNTTVNNLIDTTKNEFMEQLGKSLGPNIIDERDRAQSSAQVLGIIGEGKSLLDQGMITGSLAETKIGAIKLARAFGVPIPNDAAVNSEAFQAVMGEAVGQIIKQFGAGTGLSDADREYAAKIVGGTITLDERAIREIFRIAEKGAKADIKAWNDKVEGIVGGDIRSLLTVTPGSTPDGGGLPSGGTSERALDDPFNIRKPRGGR